jgi:hypothetical protein
MRITGYVAAAVLLLPLLGCATKLPPKESVTPAAPAGMSLPLPARVMLHVPPSDLTKVFKVEWNLFGSTHDTAIVEGKAMEAGAKSLLRRVFLTAETNTPAIQPHLVAKVTGTTRYTRIDGKFRLGCALDLFQSDGVPLGHFSGRFDSDGMDYEKDLDTAYMLCLRMAANEMLAAPSVQRLAKAGFPTPHPQATVEFLRGLGYTVAR